MKCNYFSGVIDQLDGVLSFVFYVLMFWVLINIIYSSFPEKLKKKGVLLYYGIAIVFRKPFSPRQWVFFRKVSIVWIVFFILAMFFFYNAMISNIIVKYFVHSTNTPVQLLIPGINITGIDLLFFAIAVLVAAIIHELSHAYTARAFGLRTKNIGFAVVFFLPLAFVEVDEKELSKAPVKAKVSVLSAGPASNFVLALIAMLLIPIVINPYGLLVVGAVPDSLAEKYGIHENMIIVKINGTPATLNVLHKYLLINKTILLQLTVLDSDGNRKIISLVKPANATKLGVYLQQSPSISLVKALGVTGAIIVVKLIVWFYVVNVSLAVLNAAPIFVSDGGRIIYELIKNKNLGHIINALTLAILVIALVPTL